MVIFHVKIETRKKKRRERKKIAVVVGRSTTTPYAIRNELKSIFFEIANLDHRFLETDRMPSPPSISSPPTFSHLNNARAKP